MVSCTATAELLIGGRSLSTDLSELEPLWEHLDRVEYYAYSRLLLPADNSSEISFAKIVGLSFAQLPGVPPAGQWIFLREQYAAAAAEWDPVWARVEREEGEKRMPAILAEDEIPERAETRGCPCALCDGRKVIATARVQTVQTLNGPLLM